MFGNLLTAVPFVPALMLAACQTEATPPGNAGGGTPFYVGRWAAEAGFCAAGAWVFTANTLSTAGEVSCTFNTVTPTAAGYTVQASCTAEAPPAPFTLRLSYAQSAQELLVEGGPFAAAISLIRCP